MWEMARTRLSREENTSPRLEAYLERTRTALDLLALCTLWIVVVPIAEFGVGDDRTAGGVALRLVISLVFSIDIGLRAAMAPRSWQYLRTHPLGVLAAIVPPLRVVFSLRLIGSMFRRGHIGRFLLAALALLLNGVLIVFFYERSAPGSNITTIGEALWWGVVTVSTVGYGDTYPVTVAGRIVATGIMAIGLLTVAVVTAQVSATYVEQLSHRREESGGIGSDGGTAGSQPPTPRDPPLELRHVDALHERLDRIEAHLLAASDAERGSSVDEDR